MGDVEIVVKVRVPEDIGKNFGDVIAKDVKLSILKEYSRRARRAKRILELFEKSALSEEDARELETQFKEELAQYHGVI